jgi:NOL1/NOP2/sun family putative RNA methylase
MFEIFRRYEEFIPEFQEFLRELTNFPSLSIRINTLKTSKKRLKERFDEYGILYEEVRWYEDALISEERVTHTLEYYLGDLYVQELASMIPPLILNPPENSLVLDMCAAPGSKTTQISQMMRNKGHIIANDVEMERVKILRSNVKQMGCLNVTITRKDGRKIRGEDLFDFVLVDAPCSGEGRHWKFNPSLWSEEKILSLSKLQSSLLSSAIRLVKRGGIIVYSTCTYAPEENERVISKFLDKVEVLRINSPVRALPGITEWREEFYGDEMKKTIRLFPHISGTGGFFIAKLKKI